LALAKLILISDYPKTGSPPSHHFVGHRPNLIDVAQIERHRVLAGAEVLQTVDRAKETIAVAEERKLAPKARLHRTRPLAEKAPRSPIITAYDEAHFAIYLRLLDAKSKAVSEEAMLEIILDAAPSMSHDKARRTLLSHLKRAIWMSDEGYRGLLGKKPRRST